MTISILLNLLTNIHEIYSYENSSMQFSVYIFTGKKAGLNLIHLIHGCVNDDAFGIYRILVAFLRKVLKKKITIFKNQTFISKRFNKDLLFSRHSHLFLKKVLKFWHFVSPRIPAACSNIFFKEH